MKEREKRESKMVFSYSTVSDKTDNQIYTNLFKAILECAACLVI